MLVRVHSGKKFGFQSTTEQNMSWSTHTHAHTRLTALFLGVPRSAGTRKVKPIWILLEQETVSAVASAGPYASLHLAPDR